MRTAIAALLLAACGEPRWDQAVVRVEIQTDVPEVHEAAWKAVVTWDGISSEVGGPRLVIHSPGDVVVRWTPSANVRWHNSVGATLTVWDFFSGDIRDAQVLLRTDLSWGTGDPCVGFDVERAVAHELGHALGIMRHVEDPTAIMYGEVAGCDVERRHPSPADRGALREVYR